MGKPTEVKDNIQISKQQSLKYLVLGNLLLHPTFEKKFGPWVVHQNKTVCMYSCFAVVLRKMPRQN